MKRSRALRLVLMVPVPVFLAGCSDDTPPDMTKKGFYTDIAACEKDGNAHDVCQRAFDAANTAHTTNAPKYKTREECIAEFGDICGEHPHEAGFFGPLMTGFMLSQLLSPGRPVQYIDSYPIYRQRSGQYIQYEPGYSGGGGFTSYGYSGSSSYHTVSATPNRAVTVSRSGFGSTATARSGWGGSKGSSASSSGSSGS